MRVTPDRLDVAEAALEAYAEHLMQYGRAALPPRNDLRRVIEAIPDTTEPAPDVRPKWCNVHQHHKWCEHNGGVMGPTGYAAPDVQAQIDAAVERERGRVIGIFVGELQKLHEKTVLDCGDNSCLFATRRGGMRTNGGCRCIERLLDAAVAREREEIIALIMEMSETPVRLRTYAEIVDAIRARSEKGV